MNRLPEVRIRSSCDECHGTGLVASPAWAEWWARMDAPPQPEGPEEVACGECEGAGWIEYWAALPLFPGWKVSNRVMEALFSRVRKPRKE